MNQAYYDTSWTLLAVTDTTATYRDLLSANERSLSRRAGQLHEHLNNNRPTYIDDDENAKTGGLRECTWTTIPPSARSEAHGCLITLTYDRTTCKFVLYTDSIILAKAPAALTKRIISFLSEAFSLTITPLKLPTSTLQRTLQDYLINLHASLPPNHLQSAIGTLKLTLSFSGPISPHLRTLDIDVPYDTMQHLLSSASTTQMSFLAELAKHIQSRTGLKIPLSVPKDPNEGHSSTDSTDENATIRISRISCSAFAISVEGRLKFSISAVDGAIEHGDVVKNANEQILQRIVDKASQRANHG